MHARGKCGTSQFLSPPMTGIYTLQPFVEWPHSVVILCGYFMIIVLKMGG